MKVKVARLCPILRDPVDYTIHEILQARIVEWVAFPFCGGSSLPRDGPRSHIAGRFFARCASREATGHQCLSAKRSQVMLLCSLRWELLAGLIAGSRGLRSQRHHLLPRMCLKRSLWCSVASHVRCFGTLWTAARQAPLSFIISRSLLTFMPVEFLMLSNHLILCHPFLLLSSTCTRTHSSVAEIEAVESLLVRVKDRGKAGLKLKIQKAKIMASSHITS